MIGSLLRPSASIGWSVKGAVKVEASNVNVDNERNRMTANDVRNKANGTLIL
jgi:hypothetical protein